MILSSFFNFLFAAYDSPSNGLTIIQQRSPVIKVFTEALFVMSGLFLAQNMLMVVKPKDCLDNKLSV